MQKWDDQLSCLILCCNSLLNEACALVTIPETPRNLQFEADLSCDFDDQANETAHLSFTVENNPGVWNGKTLIICTCVVSYEMRISSNMWNLITLNEHTARDIYNEN